MWVVYYYNKESEHAKAVFKTQPDAIAYSDNYIDFLKEDLKRTEKEEINRIKESTREKLKKITPDLLFVTEE